MSAPDRPPALPVPLAKGGREVGMSQPSLSLFPALPPADKVPGALLPSACPSARFNPSVLRVAGDARLNEATALPLPGQLSGWQ